MQTLPRTGGAQIQSSRRANRSPCGALPSTSRVIRAQAQSEGRAAPSGSSGNGRGPAAPRAVATVEAPPRVKVSSTYPGPEVVKTLNTDAPNILYDAVVIGSGMGGLATAAQLSSKGLKVVVLEKYLLPGGSAGHFKREGYTFDVGSSMMFGFGDKGTTNLLTKCLQSVGKKLETVSDPSQVIYHLPKSEAHPTGLEVNVHREYEDFLTDLSNSFPHEKIGIRYFYDECWRVFNALNSIELKSLEEPRYLLQTFARNPLACLTLAAYAISNTGDIARKYISDPDLLRFIDMECFIWSTVKADLTPMINAGMVFCDRHYGGINYPIGGVGRIAEELADGITEKGSYVVYKANVKEIVTEGEGDDTKAVGVRLSDGRVFRGKTIVSNATRWDTFEHMLGEDRLPPSEKLFRQRYKKSPSFFSMHLGVDASVLPPGTDCHHIFLDDWEKMEAARGTLFVSMPSLLDPSLAPAGKHIVHAFTPDWIDAWQDLSPEEYERQKEELADELIGRMEKLWPGLKKAISFCEIGTPRTHRRFLNRVDGSYGPIPSRRPLGMLSMPFNRTAVEGLYCVGDSTFPGQGVNAVVFSGFGCAHRVMCDLGEEPTWPKVDSKFTAALDFVRDRS